MLTRIVSDVRIIPSGGGAPCCEIDVNIVAVEFVSFAGAENVVHSWVNGQDGTVSFALLHVWKASVERYFASKDIQRDKVHSHLRAQSALVFAE